MNVTLKRAALVVSALLFVVPAWANEKSDKAEKRADYIRSHYSKFEYRIPMRDGTRLFTSVYLPNDASKNKTYPLLMQRTPYTVAPYGADRYRQTLATTEEFEKEGFIFVFQDVRGQHMSEGEYINMRPQGIGAFDESTDTYDTIDWLVKNIPHNNGKVGQYGISYPGFYTSVGAINSHPALKAASPQAPIADWFRGDDMHRNGAFNLQLAFDFFSGFGKARPVPTDDEEWPEFKYGMNDAYQFFRDIGGLSNVNVKHFKNEISFWNDIASHPNYDQFWQSRNVLPHLKNIKSAMLVVGGWYDTEDLYGPLKTYAAIEKQNPGIQNNLVMGPWTHGGWARTDGDKVGDTEFGFKTVLAYQDVELKFFKHHLKSAENPSLPEAWVFETGANRWRNFDAWPPKNTRAQSLFLHAGETLSFNAPTNAEDSADEYPSDPNKPVPYTQEIKMGWSKNYIAADQRFVANRPDVLVYQSEPLKNDVTIAGPLNADVYFSTTGTDADLVVKLIDVNPGVMPGWEDGEEKDGQVNRGGQQTLIRGETFRVRFRDSFETPKPLNANEVTRVKYALNDVLHTFKRGHRIMIQVHSSWFPFIDRNPQRFVPNIFEAKNSDFIKAIHRIHHSASAPSAVHINVLPALDEK